MNALRTVHDRYDEGTIAEYYDQGFWQRQSFFDLARQQGSAFEDQTFVFDDSTSVTYGEFADRALRIAVGLRRLGVQRGDRVAAQLPNWTEFPLLAVALSRIGAILVPIMPIYRGDEVGYVLRHSGAVAAVTGGEFRGFDHLGMFVDLQSQCPELRTLIATRFSAPASDVVSWESLVVDGDIDELEREAGEDASPDDGLLIVYTSGTTSRPKGCFHTFNTLRSSSAAIATSLGYTSDDIQFGPSPITHSTGLVTSVVLPMLVGASSYLMEAWEPGAGVEAVQRHGCTGAVTATPFLQMLQGAYDPQKHDLSSLRYWVCAGSPIPGPVVEQARQTLPGCQVLSLYGRSENFLTTMCTLEDPVERSTTSDGSALDGAVVHIVDADGREVPRGEEGDIAYRGPSHMIEYFRDDEQTNALFTPEGFSRSGDLGRMDEDGFVRVTGRLKDIVIRGGMNISARELEEHLAAHPKVANIAVIGMPDERLGEKVCAYVVPADSEAPLTLEDITEHLRARGVATQKLPERLEVVSEFPMTATGKIQKHLLRDDIAKKLS